MKTPVEPVREQRDRFRFARIQRASASSFVVARLLSGVMLAAGVPGAAFANEASTSTHANVDFDAETLRERGIDPRLAEYFREAPKFPSGNRKISLVLNGVKRGNVQARFDDKGGLCFDHDFLATVGLREPGGDFVRDRTAPKAQQCFDFLAAYPQTSLTLRPNREEVVLIVPQEALLRKADTILVNQGGTAGLLNYDIIAQRSTAGDTIRNYVSASAQIGVNVGDWVVRSRQIYTNDSGRERLEHLYAYAQRTFASRKATAQFGQINIASPVLGGAPIYGMQLTPETALLEQTSAGSLIEGVARTQATVEVRQSGVLIYNTVVPEGPFKLTEIPLLNTNTDLAVTIRETDGSERSFIVSAASFRTAALAPTGYSFAIGKVREISGDETALPWVVTAAGTWRLNEGTTFSAGAMGASTYQAIAGGFDTSIRRDTVVSVRGSMSNAGSEQGMQLSVAASMSLGDSFSLGGAATRQTLGYRDLADTMIPRDSGSWSERPKSQYSATMGWTNASLGSFNLAYSMNSSFSGESSDRLTASWSKMIKRATVSASVETNLGRASEQYRSGNAFFFNLSLPLGPRNVRAYASRRDGAIRTGAAMSEQVSDHLGYRIAAEHNSRSGDTYVSGNLSTTSRYAQADFSYSQNGSSRSYGTYIRGSVVAHKNGLTLSPYAVDDTLAIVKVGEISGVKVTTPYGPVWTDGAGQAVVPQLNAYKNNRIEIATKTLPRRVDIQNGVQIVGAGRGSVSQIGFNVIKTNRILVTALDSTGNPIEKGASILGADNAFLTTVLDNGTIFLSGVETLSGLKVERPDGKFCHLTIEVQSAGDEDALYDTAKGICHA